MKKLFLLITLFSTISITGLTAQNKNVYIGFRLLNDFNSLSDLSDQLEANDFPRLAENALNAEIYFRTRKADLMDGNFTMGYRERSENESSANNSRMVGYYIGFEGGKDLASSHELTLRPNLGLNLEYNRLVLVENLGASDLNSVLSNDFEKTTLSAYQAPLYVSLDLGTSFKVSNEVAIEINLTGGYRFLYFNSDSWKLDDAYTIDLDFNSSTLFAGFGVGITFLE